MRNKGEVNTFILFKFFNLKKILMSGKSLKKVKEQERKEGRRLATAVLLFEAPMDSAAKSPQKTSQPAEVGTQQEKEQTKDVSRMLEEKEQHQQQQQQQVAGNNNNNNNNRSGIEEGVVEAGMKQKQADGIHGLQNKIPEGLNGQQATKMEGSAMCGVEKSGLKFCEVEENGLEGGDVEKSESGKCEVKKSGSERCEIGPSGSERKISESCGVERGGSEGRGKQRASSIVLEVSMDFEVGSIPRLEGTHEGMVEEDTLARNILSGRLSAVPPVRKRVVRIFTSSTFTGPLASKIGNEYLFILTQLRIFSTHLTKQTSASPN